MRTRSGTILIGGILSAAMAGCIADADASASTASDAGSDGPASASAEPSERPPASAVPQPSETPGPLTIMWEEPEAFNGQPAELIVDGETWIAAGWASERGPAAWTSADAQTWLPAEVEDPQPSDEFRGSGLGPTVRLGDSLLSFGTFIGCCDDRGVLGWRSADGTSWEAIESDSPLFEVGYLVREIAASDAALVAVEIQFAEFGGRLWRWTEDTSWVETTPEAEGSDLSGIQPNDVIWAEDRFVAVGTRGDPGYREPPVGASWTSEDGQTWQESASGVELEGVRLQAVATLPGGGFAALGYEESPTTGEQVVPVAFTSPDGLAWSAVEDPFGGSRFFPHDLVAVAGGLVGFGGTADGVVVWVTDDGQSWSGAGQFGVEYQAAAATGDTLAVITADFQSDVGWQIHRATVER